MNEPTQPIQLVPTRPEAEIAVELKERMTKALVPVFAIMDEAAQHGLRVQWDQIGMNQAFRHEVVGLRVIRVY